MNWFTKEQDKHYEKKVDTTLGKKIPQPDKKKAPKVAFKQLKECPNHKEHKRHCVDCEKTRVERV